MASLRVRQIESENRGDRPWPEPGIEPGSDLESSLIEVLEQSIKSAPGLLPCRVDLIRSWTARHGEEAGWPTRACRRMSWDDGFAAISVLYWTARLKRMTARHQWACNKLLQLGFPREGLPAGDERV